MRELQARTQDSRPVISKKTIMLSMYALSKMRRNIFFDAFFQRTKTATLKLNIENAILELRQYLEDLNDRKNP